MEQIQATKQTLTSKTHNLSEERKGESKNDYDIPIDEEEQKNQYPLQLKQQNKRRQKKTD